MGTKTTAMRGEMLPDVTLPSEGGRKVRLSDFRGRLNLVVVLAGGMDHEDLLRLLASLGRKRSDIIHEEAVVVVISSKNRVGQSRQEFRADWPLVALIDPEDHAHWVFDALSTEGTAVPAILIADRYGEIWAEYRSGEAQGLPDTNEILQWLFFINSQCPECGVPNWPG